MASVGDIAINVTADIGPLVKNFGRASNATSKFGRTQEKIARKMKNFGKGVTRLGKKMSVLSAGMTAAGVAAFALAKGTADAGNQIAKNARGAGVAADYYQEMAYAIGQVSDVSESELTSSFQRLSRTIGEGADGTKQASDALEQLGFTQSQIASGTITTQQAFDAYIKKMDGLKDPALAAALSNDLLGRSGVRLGAQLAGAGGSISTLRDRANSLGLVLSKDALDASERFTDQMDDLKRSFQAVKLKLGADLLPLFSNKLIPLFQEKVIPKIAELGEKIGAIATWFGDLPEPVLEAAGVIAAAFAVGGPILIGIGLVSSAMGALVAAAGPIGLMIAAASLLTAAWVKWGDDFTSAVGGAIDWITEKFTAFTDYIKAIPEQLLQVGRDMIQGLMDGIREKWEELKATVYEMAEALPNWMKELLGIESPSRVFMEIGNFIGQGLAEGISQSQSLVQRAVGQLSGAAVDGSAATRDGVLANMQTMFQGSKKLSAAFGIANSWLAFTEVLKDPSFIGNPFGRIAAAGAALSAGLNAVRNIKSASPGGGGGGGSAATPTAVAAPPPERKFAEFRVEGQNVTGLRPLTDQINDLSRRGYQVNVGLV